MFYSFPAGIFSECWPHDGIGIEPINGKSFMLGTASLSALGYENSISHPVMGFGNDTHHVLTSTGQDAARAHASATNLQTTR